MNGLMMDDYPLALTRIVDRAERIYGGRAIVWRDGAGDVRRTTYARAIERARRVGSSLRGLGIEPGERVATLLWNQPEHLELYFAITGSGAVIHTLNPRLHADELAFIAGDAGSRAIVVDESLVPVLDSFSDRHRFDHVIVVGAARLRGAAIDYEQLMQSEPLDWSDPDERAAAAMCYTSGTTGRPKGVLYSHRALVLHSLTAALGDALGVAGADTVLPVVPMFHVNAWGLPYAAAFTGAALVLPGQHLDAVSVLDLLAGERVTMTAGVPTVWLAVLGALDAEPDRWDLSALRTLVIGGSAAPRSMIEGFDRHGIEVVQAWGMTEMSPLGTVCRIPPRLSGAPAPDRTGYRARQGVPIPFVETRARDESGAEIPWDDTALGELEVRGPWVAAAYHGGDGAEKFTDDGWFQTGDIVAIDPGGCIRIADRAKDLIKSGGEWISSVDLENALMGHPAVAEAAVVAIPDERWGERPLAAIVLNDGAAVDGEALRAHLARDFAKWQLPDRFEFIEAIPRTATGKWRKRELRQRFADVAADTAAP